MSVWNFRAFNEMIDEKTDVSVVLGRPLSGKTFLANLL